jgi:hypothetical protein
MSASIKILKESLKDHPGSSAQLSLLCVNVKEELDACVYTPEPGVLMTCLKLLNDHKISYEILYGSQSDIIDLNSNQKVL